MAWRYQPVWIEHNGELVYSLCEVYFDKAGKLEHWTESPAMIPQGDGDVQGLRKDLTHMLCDAVSLNQNLPERADKDQVKP